MELYFYFYVLSQITKARPACPFLYLFTNKPRGCHRRKNYGLVQLQKINNICRKSDIQKHSCKPDAWLSKRCTTSIGIIEGSKSSLRCNARSIEYQNHWLALKAEGSPLYTLRSASRNVSKQGPCPFFLVQRADWSLKRVYPSVRPSVRGPRSVCCAFF